MQPARSCVSKANYNSACVLFQHLINSRSLRGFKTFFKTKSLQTPHAGKIPKQVRDDAGVREFREENNLQPRQYLPVMLNSFQHLTNSHFLQGFKSKTIVNFEQK